MDVIANVGDMRLVGTTFVVVTLLWAWRKFIKTGPVYKGDAQLIGKTVIITGGNAGVGKATAVCLAKRGARVIIACRNAEKAVADIRAESGSGLVYSMKLDLADLESIKAFAEEVMESEPRLHILVNNAAVVSSGKTKQGMNLMFGTNQLGPFLLTNLLMPLLRKTSEISPVRIVNLGSDGYRLGKVDLENLNPIVDDRASTTQVFVQYCNTKLMTIFFTMELDRKLREENPQSYAITTYCAHPGVVRSRLGGDYAENKGWPEILLRHFILNVFAKSPFYGCQTTLYCCLEEGIEEQSGKYFADMKQTKLLPHACDEKLSRNLWKKCEELAGIA